MTEQQESNKEKNPVVKLVNNRNFLVFLAFVVLSFFLWFLNYLNKNLTSEITIKYKFKNIPKAISTEESLNGEFMVSASGQGYNLLQESLKTRNIPLNIDLEAKAQDGRPLLKYVSEKGYAYILTNDIKPIIRKKIGDKINIGDISPDTLFFDLINVKEKKVPVDISSIEYQLLDGQSITSTMIVPDSVTIIGRKSSIDSIVSINVKHIDLGLLKDKKQYSIALDIPEGISASQNIVSLSHNIEMFTMAIKNIRIKAENFPPEYNYTLLPQYINVTYSVPLSFYDKVYDNDFTAIADYNNTKGNIIEIKVQNNNEKAKILGIKPETCTFILEHK